MTRGGWAGVAVLACIVAACLAAPWYAQAVSGTDPFRSNPLGQVAGRDVLAEHPAGLGTLPMGPQGWGPYALGADGLGRDVAARILWGGRTSLLVAGLATGLCFVLGGALGVAAGAVGGAVDRGVSAMLDLVWAFPVTLLAIALSLVLVAGPVRVGPLVLGAGGVAGPVLVLGVMMSPYVARPVRAAMAGLRAADFVEAARATGGSGWRVVWRHMLPQLGPLVGGLVPVVAATMLLTEAALSVLGVGVQAPGASWGTLIADGQDLLHERPVAALAPGACVVLTVLALNMLAEGLVRDGHGRR